MKKIIKFIFEPYMVGIRLLYLGIWEICLGLKELIKLVYHFPMHSVFVVCITTIFIVIGYAILMGEEFQFLPSWMRIMALWTLGISSFIASICWSIRTKYRGIK